MIDYTFTDRQLVESALTHRSAGSANNERLEFLGDAILGFVIADELYRRFKDADEGQLSRMRAGLVKGETLAAVARDLKLGEYLKLGSGELRSGGQNRSSILADALEALFGAICLDGGADAVRRIILNLFQARFNELSPGMAQKDPKTRLQEHLQARGLDLPDYSILDIVGEQHNQLFRVKCSVTGLELEAEGSGNSRRKAEQDAADRLMASINQIGRDSKASGLN